MTTLDDLNLFDTPPQRARTTRVRKADCVHPDRDRRALEDGGWACAGCGKDIEVVAVRRGRNNRKRGLKNELTTARLVGGRKVGPLGYPWDIEMPGYARIQVRKYATPQSLRKIAAELARIGSGPEMPGYIWVEPGRGGERLIVFRLADFAERHGIPALPADPLTVVGDD